MLFHHSSGANHKKFICTSCSHQFLERQDLIGSNTFFDPDMLHFRLVFITKIIKAQTVYFAVDNICQVLSVRCTERYQNAFKYRILNPSSIVDALFLPFAVLFTSCCFCVHIICDQYKHLSPHFQRKTGYSSGLRVNIGQEALPARGTIPTPLFP